MICPTCNTPNINEARFCLSCGHALSAPTSAAYSAVVAAPLDDEITRAAPSLIQNIPNGVNVRASGSPPQTHDDPMIGMIIEGKYKLIAKLGTGGMGCVYRAERLLIGDQVAVKILHQEHVAQPQSFERFRREAQAAARLKH